MARVARIVVPGAAHHITQRGNRGERAFFEDRDYRLYLDWLAEAAAKAGTEVWAYCLMPNHVHLILTPSKADGVRATLADTHRRYTNHINTRNQSTGHLWQGRFASVAMDEAHLINALRYVSLNPVRAKLARTAADWPWSSVRAHLAGRDDGVVKVTPALERVGDFTAFLGEGFDDASAFGALRRSETTGRPLGGAEWIKRLEAELHRPIAPRKRGPKPR